MANRGRAPLPACLLHGNASDDPDTGSFGNPALVEHSRADGKTCRVTMIGRSALSVVVEMIKRLRPCCAIRRRVRKADREHESPELPVGIVCDDRALACERGVEMRALRCEARAEESADVRSASSVQRINLECLTGPCPTYEHAIVKLGDLIRDRRDKEVIKIGMVIFDGGSIGLGHRPERKIPDEIQAGQTD